MDLEYLNVVRAGRTFDCVVSLTTFGDCSDGSVCNELGSFSIELAEANVLQKEGGKFCDYSKIIDVGRLSLPAGIGDYIIKVLVKDSQEKDYMTLSARTIL